MTRYRSIVATWDSDLEGMIHMPGSIEVHESSKAAQPTGLLDANGTPLYRIQSTVRFGFHKGD